MKLTGARVAVDANSAIRRDIVIAGGRFGPDAAGPTVDLTGYLLLPGLINAHDHLDLNLFPRLGNGVYPNATKWAAEIYRPGDSPVKEHLAVPRHARLMWGGIRNLLCGVTTVAHHNSWNESVFAGDFPVRVARNVGWAHSLAFSTDVRERFDACPGSWPFVIHAAEGTDADARGEVLRLDALGVLSDRTVLVHAVGAHAEDIEILRKRGCSVVWCPRSNLATCGKTLGNDVLRSGIHIALGTDSALTTEGDLADEILAAREYGMTAGEIYAMVTSEAARILRLRDGEGEIVTGGVADLIAVADTGQSPAEALFDLRPQLVIVGGCVKLLSPALHGRFDCSLTRLEHETRGSLWIDAPVPDLLQQAAAALGALPKLAGRRVAA